MRKKKMQKPIINMDVSPAIPMMNFVTSSITMVNEQHLSFLRNVLVVNYASRRFTYVLHIDYANVDNVNVLAQTISDDLNHTLAVYNPDERLSYRVLRNPLEFDKFIHLVVVADPLKIRRYFRKGNVILYDVIIFVDLSGQMGDRFWSIEELKWAGRSIHLDLTTEIMYTRCFYCGEKHKEIVRVKTAEDYLPSNFRKLHGHHLNVVNGEFFPWTFCRSKYDEHDHCDNLDGTEYSLLKTLSEKLNFSFSTFTYGQRDGEIFDLILSGKADFAIGGISVSRKRFEKASFTKFIRHEPITFLYLYRSDWFTFMDIYLIPFQFGSWLIVLLFLFAQFIYLSYLFKGQISRSKCFLTALRMLIDQSYRIKLTKRHFWMNFCILTAFFIMCSTFSISYRSVLASVWISPPHYEPKNAMDLLMNNYEIVTGKNRRLKLFTELFSSEDPFLDYTQRYGKSINSLCDQIVYIIKNKAAIIEEKSHLSYHALYDCAQLIYPVHFDESSAADYNPDNLRITAEPIRTSIHSIAVRPNAPFWKPFDYVIGSLQNGGFLNKWTNDALREINRFKHISYSKDDTLDILTAKEKIKVYFSCFSLLIVGNSVAFIVFLCEVCIKHFSK